MGRKLIHIKERIFIQWMLELSQIFMFMSTKSHVFERPVEGQHGT